MISNDQKEMMKKVMDESMAKFIKQMPEMIHRNASGAVAEMFGFENGNWGKWKIDHCNGRNSTISDWIGAEAKRIFKEECEKIITKKLIKSIIKDAKQEIEREISRKLRYEISNTAMNACKKEIENISKSVIEELKCSVKCDIDSINQSAMAGNLSETETAVLEREIEENTKK
jgi:hypothetical protein